MWTLLEIIILTAIVLISITEFFVPLIMNKPLFGSFRKSRTSEAKNVPDGSLDEKITKTKEKVEEVKEVVKEVQSEVAQNFKTAEQLKEESDNLLK
ncbi:MAG: hypothetical protein JNL63_02240 [Bacteroidia bacterium]|nr:hypothetical protein [Bacteroidia bacterium]